MCRARMLVTVALAVGLLVTGIGCSGKDDGDEKAQTQTDKEKGLFERAGSAADSAVEKGVDAGAKAYEKTKEVTGKVVEKTGEVVDKAREKTGDGLKKTGEWIAPDKETEKK